MTYFDPSNRRRPRPGGWLFLGLFVIAFGSLMAIPTGYVIERPGTSFNVMGELDSVPVIDAQDVAIYESDTRFDVLTVSLVGNREATPSWLQVLLAWLDPDQLVLPLDEVYPPNVTAEQIKAESAAQMETSQQDAIAAALNHLGYPVTRLIYVSQVFEDAPASGKVIAADVIQSVDGNPIATFEELKDAIAASAGDVVALGVLRGDRAVSLQLEPVLNNGNWVVGIGVGYTYEFPVKIDLQLGEVGGPSGGLVFTMGIIDKLTEGSIFDDTHIAGTGTIAATGEVGAIGGVKLKMLAASDSGADLFIGPRSNCSEIAGSEPAGLPVGVVESLDQALELSASFAKDGSVPAKFLCENN